MAHSLCIVDDGFMKPATACQLEHHQSFSGSTLEMFLSQNWDNENALKNLCTLLVDENNRSSWNINAFITPMHFQASYDDDNYRPDVVVFDWEYGIEFDQVNFLKQFLSRNHIHVFVFTGYDKNHEVEAVLKDDLSQFASRLHLLPKDNEGNDNSSHSDLLRSIEENQRVNFASKFGKKLRRITNESLDDVLYRLSKMDIKKVVDFLGGSGGSEHVDNDIRELVGIKIKDKLKESSELRTALEKEGVSSEKISELIDFISEKAKDDIISTDLSYEEPPRAGGGDELEVIESLWSYRMYHKPHDSLVRTGDLIKSNADDGKLYLVLTGPCSLNKFWSSTAGQLIVVELFDVELHKELIKSDNELLTDLAGQNFKSQSFKITSLTNAATLKSLAGSPIMIPCVPAETGYRNYVLFPQTFQSLRVDMPENIRNIEGNGAFAARKQKALEYDHFEYTRVCAVSDPFLAPLVGSIISGLFGWGVPDYPPALQKGLGQKVKGVFE